MTSDEIRRSFLEFFKERQHTIVPSSSLLPDSPNLLFTNAGMNQFVPIFLGERACPYRPPRAADTQKCIRAGGKHNDLDDVGLDTYHHTFFEMLGNWSFGDYFKAEAISWAWQLVVERWGFPPARLYATIYQPGPGDPGTTDEEARTHWAEKFRSVGLDPAIHVLPGNRKDNFWMMGDTGPCGPCSELHIDLTPAGDTRGALVNTSDPRCMEIWNLVFIEFNACPDGTFPPLPARHVDTGMGFERVTSIIQGTRGLRDFTGTRISNYETDIFSPIFDALSRLTHLRYGSSLPGSGAPTEAQDIAFRVIADHLRALCFAIADGILPGNSDRHYVLRRILRRALRYGRTLGLEKPFLHTLAAVLADTMGRTFPELATHLDHIQTVLAAEEEAFLRTLGHGIALFEAEAARLAAAGTKTIPGHFVFRLYDEQGFPPDLTELLGRERGLTVDSAGFEQLMAAQRERARSAQRKQTIELTSLEAKPPTEFVGYHHSATVATILEIVSIKNQTALILDRTPCFAEMGGQLSDTGTITQDSRQWQVSSVSKINDTFLHFLQHDPAGDLPQAGTSVQVTIDTRRRAAIERHHSATHLLHWALHQIVSPAASQKGSSVGPDKFTFDFNSSPLTPAQLSDLEHLVNERILDDAPVSTTIVPYAEVKSRPDIMQFFGDKYAEHVRVVQIGGQPGSLNGFSMELCGGTHVRSTARIGPFRILSEAAIASGIRRIEAVAGWSAIDSARRDAALLARMAATLQSPLGEIEARLEALLEQKRQLEKALLAARQREAASLAARLEPAAESLHGIPAIIQSLDHLSGDQLQDVVAALKPRFPGVVLLLSSPAPQEVAIVASVSPEHSSACHAGKLLAAVAQTLGGKGGGRPEFARGAGKNPSAIPQALELARQLIASAKSPAGG